jgi:hypothetical protein
VFEPAGFHYLTTRDLLRPANIVFLAGGIYFFALVALRESSVLVLSAMVLCLVSFVLAFLPEHFLISAWRSASCVFVLIILAAQVGVDILGFNPATIFGTASFLVNGIFLLLFLATLLSSARSLTSGPIEKEKVTEEEEETAPERRTSEAVAAA